MLGDMLNANDLVMMSETIEGVGYACTIYMEVFEDKVVTFSLKKNKVMVSRGIKKDGQSICKPYSCGLSVKANLALFVKHGKWNHGRCSK